MPVLLYLRSLSVFNFIDTKHIFYLFIDTKYPSLVPGNEQPRQSVVKARLVNKKLYNA